MTTATSSLIMAYGLMLCIVGFAGVFAARWGLASTFNPDLDAMSSDTRATFLNQYRFLNGGGLGAGLFCVGLRRQVLAGRRASNLLLALVGAGVAGRIIAWMVDGQPSVIFIGFLLLEALVFVAVALHLMRQNVD